MNAVAQSSETQLAFEQRVEQRAKQTAALDQLGIRASTLGTPGAVQLAVMVAQLRRDVDKLQAQREATSWRAALRRCRSAVQYVVGY